MPKASITPSDVIQYLYCPRFTYFEHVLAIPQHEEKSYKAMRGRNLHDYKQGINKDYLRKKIGVTGKHQEQYLTNDFLRGKVDEVLELDDDTMAPLDYKFAEYKDRIYNTYKTQLYCYAWLIEDNFETQVKRGYLVYTRSKNKLIEVNVSEKAKQKVRNAATEIIDIINTNRFPKATRYKKRCTGCTYRNICIK
jgi:CRISPR-associated exonuclease Cas4